MYARYTADPLTLRSRTSRALVCELVRLLTMITGMYLMLSERGVSMSGPVDHHTLVVLLSATSNTAGERIARLSQIV